MKGYKQKTEKKCLYWKWWNREYLIMKRHDKNAAHFEQVLEEDLVFPLEDGRADVDSVVAHLHLWSRPLG